MTLRATTSQTVGPFFSIGLAHLESGHMAAPSVPGERVVISGRVLDGNGEPVPDALLEFWQADANGRYATGAVVSTGEAESPFIGFGRVAADDGNFSVTTIKPGAVPGPNGSTQAPHIVVSVFARGLLRRLVTRIYFPDDPLNATDYVLALVPPDRRNTLIAERANSGGDQLLWSVRLQGKGETVFFDC